MANLNPERAFDALKDRVKAAISAQFPITGKKHRVELVKLEVKDTYDIDDIKSQHETKLKDGTWEVPVIATLRLIDIESGKVLDEARMSVAKLPKITRRYSYIIKGNERQRDSVFRLKPGIYHRIADNGVIRAQWNAYPGHGFDLHIDREDGTVKMKVGSSNIPLYSVLKALNVPDATIEKKVGADVFQSYRQSSKATDVPKLLKALAYNEAEKKEIAKLTPLEMGAKLQETYAKTSLKRPDGSGHNTLGVHADTVTGEALLHSAARLLDISKGAAEPDDRHALSSKDIHGTEDFIAEVIIRKQREIARKILNTLDSKNKLADISFTNMYTGAIRSTFDESQFPEQHNPTAFVSGHLRTTLLGADVGGVKGEHGQLDEDQLINPTHLGFLDPVQTPEKGAGIILHLPIGVRRQGHELVTKVWDVKAGKYIDASPGLLERAVVAYPDQVRWKDGKPIPRENYVTVYDENRATSKRPWSAVQYVLPSAKNLFSFNANLIPFLQTNSGPRASFASKQMEQAVALKDREAPLVQNKSEGEATYEHLMGLFSAHIAPKEGVVKHVSADAVHLEHPDGTRSTLQLYNHFPLNGGKDMLNSIPLVKVGDRVSKLQTVADSNFTKNGVLALGKNLRVGYTTFHGKTFEDSIVISESASKKLVSEHLHVSEVTLYAGMSLNLRMWRTLATADRTTPARLAKLDADGIVRVGERVVYGDVLAAVVNKKTASPEEAVIGVFGKALNRPFEDRHTLIWDHDFAGTVVRTVNTGKTVKVFVKTEERASVGDKLTARYGNKGIIGSVIPDHDMPHDKDGRPLEVILGPAGVPSRMNVGQVLETAASKIARKTGAPYVTDNFAHGVDATQKVLDDLAKHGLSDTEEMFDPKTQRSLGQILVGDQYIFKLHHMVDKKMTARGDGTGGAPGYTSEGASQSGRGIPGGGKAADPSMVYGLLAHGAKANIREMMTWKSDKDQAEVWGAIKGGKALPDPVPNRSMGRFIGYARGLGINMEKQGNQYTLAPLTDAQTLKFSNGNIKFPEKALTAKDIRTMEDVGGLFDPKITGGMAGKYWSHMTLARRIPNPIFKAPIREITGMTEKEYNHLTSVDGIVDGKSGFDVINQRLAAIDVAKELPAAEASLAQLKGPKLDKAYRRVKYLRALSSLGMTALDAYTNKHIPVLPPSMRKVQPNIDGTQTFDDLNGLYRGVGLLNSQLANVAPGTPTSTQHEITASLYDSVQALRVDGLDMGARGKSRHHSGIMEKLTGDAPKTSFFQKNLMGRRQDLSGRSTIITAPELGVDEVGLPLAMAMEMYKPFIVREVSIAHGVTPLAAGVMVKNKDQAAVHALHRIVASRPVILKRDPVLHQHGVQAFTPKITHGKAIGLNPLVAKGFNADHDGDEMTMFVPISHEAVHEARKMFPSQNLFSPTTGKVVPLPQQDGLLGLYQATAWGSRFKEADTHPALTRAEALTHMEHGKVKPWTLVHVDGKTTTPGRLLLASVLPHAMQDHEKLLYDPSFRLDDKHMTQVLNTVAADHPQDYARVVDAWKDAGNKISYLSGSSFSLKDFHDGVDFRTKVLAPYKKEEAVIRASSASQQHKDAKIVELYGRAIDEIKEKGLAHYKSSNNRVFEWAASGARGGWGQFGQLVVGPVLVTDAKGAPVATPILRSYGEGLSISDYWTQMHGARKGAVDRASATSKPGAMTKVIVNTAINTTITSEDCKTKKGVSMSPSDPDAVDRYLAQSVHEGRVNAIAGSLLTPPLLAEMRANKVDRIIVRSPLYCQMSLGICQHCYGLRAGGGHYAVGTNIGVIAGQALGEPITQLTMRTFHSGGAVQKGGYEPASFERVAQIFNVPKTLKGAATIALSGGTITRVTANTSVGGHDVYVDAHKYHVPSERMLLEHTKAGTVVKAGQPLSDGPIQPHDLLKATKNIREVRAYLADEGVKSYGKLGVKRRNIETVIRAMTDVTSIEHAPGHPEFLRGQYASLARVEHLNRKAAREGISAIEHTPQLLSMESVPLSHSEDWMGRLNFQEAQRTFERGAAMAWTSDIHESTVAGIAHAAEFGKRAPKRLEE